MVVIGGLLVWEYGWRNEGYTPPGATVAKADTTGGAPSAPAAKPDKVYVKGHGMVDRADAERWKAEEKEQEEVLVNGEWKTRKQIREVAEEEAEKKRRSDPFHVVVGMTIEAFAVCLVIGFFFQAVSGTLPYLHIRSDTYDPYGGGRLSTTYSRVPNPNAGGQINLPREIGLAILIGVPVLYYGVFYVICRVPMYQLWFGLGEALVSVVWELLKAVTGNSPRT